MTFRENLVKTVVSLSKHTFEFVVTSLGFFIWTVIFVIIDLIGSPISLLVSIITNKNHMTPVMTKTVDWINNEENFR
jgi:hypothetical protein